MANPPRRCISGFLSLRIPRRPPVGLGDVPRLDDQPAVVAAVERAGATDVVERLTSGLDTQLGPTWPGGVELSFGQSQKLALARGFMRDQPLLLILDEPRRPRRGNRARPLRTLRRCSPRRRRQRDRPHHHPRLPPFLHRPHGRPHRSPRRIPPRRSRYPRPVNGAQRTLLPALHHPSLRLPLTSPVDR